MLFAEGLRLLDEQDSKVVSVTEGKEKAAGATSQKEKLAEPGRKKEGQVRDDQRKEGRTVRRKGKVGRLERKTGYHFERTGRWALWKKGIPNRKRERRMIESEKMGADQK